MTAGEYTAGSSGEAGSNLHPFRVTAPASTANLGAGFDVAGAALELRNALVVSPGSGRVTVTGEGEGTLPLGAENLVVQALEQAAPGFHAIVDLECENRIPLARGLGSSAAAAALGLAAGWTLMGERWDAGRLAHEVALLDGHPDNAAACAHGGLTLARDLGGEQLTVLHIDVPAWLAVVLVVPAHELSTARARAALPGVYERPVVGRVAGHAALLAASLAQGNREVFTQVLERDVAHEPHRAELVPELGQVRAALAQTPAYGATLSGAGPSIAAWCDPADVDRVADALRAGCGGMRVEPLALAPRGTCVEH